MSEGWGWLQDPPDLLGMEAEGQASVHQGLVPSFLDCPCPSALLVPLVPPLGPLVPLVHPWVHQVPWVHLVP